MDKDDLLREVEAFLAQGTMRPTYFGRVACKNGELVKRLRAGGSVRLETANRIRAFISERERAQ